MSRDKETNEVPTSPPGGWPVPRSLYIHVPFCRHRCGYCNFSVVAGRDDLIDSFLKAIDHELAELSKPQIDTLFLGGGTPTHLSIGQLQKLLEIVSTRVNLRTLKEWSVEANPEDIDAEKLSLLAEFGVNRISLGVQSFDAKKLQTLERSHDGDTAQNVIQLSSEIIPNVSIDLIFAAPDETIGVWKNDLRIAMSLPLKHLSTYALTFEKGTTFWNSRKRGALSQASEADEVEMYRTATQLSDSSGWSQYEISSFARDEHYCLHNLAYWQGRGWFAAGPGAARFVNGVREVNHRSSTTYLKKILSGQSVVAESERISVEQFARERAAFGLRMLRGIDLDELSQETGIDITSMFAEEITGCTDRGWLRRSEGRLALTSDGVFFADSVASEFLG